MGRFWRTIILAVILGSVVAITAAAGERQYTAPRLFGIFAPKPGVWSEYAVYDKASGGRTVIHISIVGIEDDAYWYEVVNMENDNRYIVKMLVQGDPNDPANILRIITKSGANPAQETPGNLMPMDSAVTGYLFEERSGIPVRKLNLRNIKTGEGKATVPAGSFTVSLHQIIDRGGKVYAKYKLSREVRPFGIVSSETENTTVVLVGRGTGAKSLITEEPILMSRPPDLPKGVVPLQDMPPAANSKIRQIPGMGTGYEPKRKY